MRWCLQDRKDSGKSGQMLVFSFCERILTYFSLVFTPKKLDFSPPMSKAVVDFLRFFSLFAEFAFHNSHSISVDLSTRFPLFLFSNISFSTFDFKSINSNLVSSQYYNFKIEFSRKLVGFRSIIKRPCPL